MLSAPGRQAKRIKQWYDFLLKYAVFALFGPILACFRLFFVHDYCEIFAGKHILLSTKIRRGSEIAENWPKLGQIERKWHF